VVGAQSGGLAPERDVARDCVPQQPDCRGSQRWFRPRQDLDEVADERERQRRREVWQRGDELAQARARVRLSQLGEIRLY